MRTLEQAVTKRGGNQETALMKHLFEANIREWNDLTRANLCDFRDDLLEKVAVSSAHTYLAILKAVIARYEDEVTIPCKDYREVLKCKNDKPMKTYLTLDELKQLERVETRTEVERYVLDEFLIGAYTGMRISDTKETTQENIQDGVLRYVSIKTKVHSTVPLKAGLEERISRVRANDTKVTLANYNIAIRRLCKRAGINTKVKVRKGGRDLTGEKWEFISSHSARISFCSNMSKLGVGLIDIARMAGHTNTQMTERYIAVREVKLSEKAMRYFE